MVGVSGGGKTEDPPHIPRGPWWSQRDGTAGTLQSGYCRRSLDSRDSAWEPPPRPAPTRRLSWNMRTRVQSQPRARRGWGAGSGKHVSRQPCTLHMLSSVPLLQYALKPGGGTQTHGSHPSLYSLKDPGGNGR
jgi:hypothetical protein